MEARSPSPAMPLARPVSRLRRNFAVDRCGDGQPKTTRISLFQRLIAFLNELLAARRGRTEARRGIAYLRTLDDRTLCDIGVIRSWENLTDQYACELRRAVNFALTIHASDRR